MKKINTRKTIQNLHPDQSLTGKTSAYSAAIGMALTAIYAPIDFIIQNAYAEDTLGKLEVDGALEIFNWPQEADSTILNSLDSLKVRVSQLEENANKASIEPETPFYADILQASEQADSLKNLLNTGMENYLLYTGEMVQGEDSILTAMKNNTSSHPQHIIGAVEKAVDESKGYDEFSKNTFNTWKQKWNSVRNGLNTMLSNPQITRPQRDATLAERAREFKEESEIADTELDSTAKSQSPKMVIRGFQGYLNGMNKVRTDITTALTNYATKQREAREAREAQQTNADLLAKLNEEPSWWQSHKPELFTGIGLLGAIAWHILLPNSGTNTTTIINQPDPDTPTTPSPDTDDRSTGGSSGR